MTLSCLMLGWGVEACGGLRRAWEGPHVLGGKPSMADFLLSVPPTPFSNASSSHLPVRGAPDALSCTEPQLKETDRCHLLPEKSPQQTTSNQNLKRLLPHACPHFFLVCSLPFSVCLSEMPSHCACSILVSDFYTCHCSVNRVHIYTLHCL